MARILIVDDEPFIREILRGLLELDGHDIVEAGSGVEALEVFETQHPDVIVSDVMMPEMDGFALLSELQPLIQDRIPFLFVTSHDDPEGVEAAMHAGAFDYIAKPFDPSQVHSVIERALRSTGREF